LRLTLIAVGKVSESFIQDACAVYAARILRYAAFHLVVIPQEKISAEGKIDFILRQEGRRIREKLDPGAFTVALDERGKLLSSAVFGRLLARGLNSGRKETAFILGGPYGLDESLKEGAGFRLSLSPMTLAHGMARMLLLEQIYRAFTLIRGEPYHK
jgi:23S rRNA (pseudouridine1915-N3)-methyltransferase